MYYFQKRSPELKKKKIIWKISQILKRNRSSRPEVFRKKVVF